VVVDVTEVSADLVRDQRRVALGEPLQRGLPSAEVTTVVMLALTCGQQWLRVLLKMYGLSFRLVRR
jgi:hypothetical protein